MRVELQTPSIEARPRESAQASLRVQNTSGVIDEITVRAVGLDPSSVRCEPAALPLFPGADGVIDLTITLPVSYPAGDHVVTLELASTADPALVEQVDLQMQVAPHDDVSMSVRPRTITGGTRAEVAVVCRNDGNVPRELTLVASDAEHAVRHEFDPPFLHLRPGEEAISLLRLEGRRPFSGQNANRRVTVTAVLPDRQLTAALTFSQRPRIRRALVTVAILGAILALWALLFTLAIDNAMGSQVRTKEFPASAIETIGVALIADGPVPGAAAARLDSTVAGGTVTGVVTAQSDGQPVGRITIEALRRTDSGTQLVRSAATDTDGSYELAGLVGGTYLLKFSAPGFEEVWYPSATSEAAAQPIRVEIGAAIPSVDVQIVGVPGAVVGFVDTGDGVAPTPVTVTVRSVVEGVVGDVVTETTTDGAGTYSVSGLATPGTYDLSFSAPGFEPASLQQRLGGGEVTVANAVRMTAGPGSIGGRVTAGGVPLGGVQITAMSGDQTRATATPTSGAIGMYELADLPTPGTYVLSFTREGYGPQTIAIELGPGESRLGIDIDMVGGSGTITGRVTGAGGAGVGDVTVTVSGGPTGATTTTLTAGDVGAYRLTGLPTPATYTLTFTATGYRSETLSVTLGSNGSASGVDVALARSVGSITGTVRDASTSTPLSGVDITVTDGADVRTGRSASAPPGEFAVGDLPAGAWSATFSAPGYRSQTVLVNLAPGATETIAVDLVPG